MSVFVCNHLSVNLWFALEARLVLKPAGAFSYNLKESLLKQSIQGW